FCKKKRSFDGCLICQLRKGRSSARKGVLVLDEAHCAREYRALRSVGKR
ncbi:hypothetical protein A2U01_0102243, partial [Trifolium medium]|nr:hypothetical protein [Trifolium medium]